ncbi:MAG: FumA C-terminus/TtdB family hydratase beta subunit [Candidatus Methanogranum gryphiswaldense]|nr:MAG: FumA C-terminus/TtdB family hydratase beta subunit [Candidatus Methanogranum sp. U3.2.1]
MRSLRSPLSYDTIKGLKLGEVVSISGPIITGRDEMHMRAIEYSNEGRVVPKEIKNSVLYHCGPIMVKDGNNWTVIAAGPTTSARMNKLEPEMIRRFSIRAIIGKGGMSSEVLEAMKETGCVYLAATGGAAVSLAEGLSKVAGVEWEDLGMAEAMWKFDTDNLGPLVVAMDCHGNSLYENVRKSLIRD